MQWNSHSMPWWIFGILPGLMSRMHSWGIRKGWTKQCSNIFQHNTHRNYSNCIKMHQKHRNLTDVKFPNILATTASIKALCAARSETCNLHVALWFCTIQEKLGKTEFEQSRTTMNVMIAKERAEMISRVISSCEAAGFSHVLHHVKFSDHTTQLPQEK